MNPTRSTSDPVVEEFPDATPSNVGLLWITGTGPITTNPDIQRVVRRHVMLRYRKQLKAPDLRKPSISSADREIIERPLHFFQPGDGTSAKTVPLISSCPICKDSSTTKEGQHIANCNCQKLLHVDSISDFCVTQKDPFFRYPIDVTPQDVKLIDYILDDTNMNKVVHRHETLHNSMSDPIAFHQMLGNFASWLCFKLKVSGGEKYLNRDAIIHHGKAIRALNERIRDGFGVVNEGTITAVLGFAHAAHVRRDFSEWSNHMNGVKEIVKLRGGIQTLNPELKNTLYWHDLGGASTQVTQLLFDWSTDPISNLYPLIVPPTRSSPSLNQVSKVWLSRFPDQPEFLGLLEYLYRIAVHFTEEFSLTGGSTDVNFSLRYMVKPMLNRLLNFDTTVATRNENSACLLAIMESCRLAALMFLAPLRRLFGVYPVVSTIQLEKLQKLLVEDKDVNWQGLEVLQFWVVTMGYLESRDNRIWWRDERDKLGLQLFLDTQLREFVWIDLLHGVQLIETNRELN